MEEINQNGHQILDIVIALCDALDWPCNPASDDIRVGGAFIGVRRDGFAGEINFMAHGVLQVMVEADAGPSRATARITGATSIKAMTYDIDASIRWSACGSVTPEEGATFSQAVLAWSGRLQLARAALEPLKAMSKEAREDGISQFHTWLDVHAEQFVATLSERDV